MVAKYANQGPTLPTSTRWSPTNQAGGTSAIHPNPLDRDVPSEGALSRSGTYRTNAASTVLLNNAISKCKRPRGAIRTSTPTIPVMANTANADALTLVTAHAVSRKSGVCSRHGFIDVSSIIGTSATWATTMKRPLKKSSAAILAPKMTALRTGKGPRMRKSRSSGNNDSLASSVMNASRSIGRPIISMSSPRSACRYGSGVAALASAPYLSMKIRVSSNPTATTPPATPSSMCLNESAPACVRMPKSNIARKKCPVSCHPVRSANGQHRDERFGAPWWTPRFRLVGTMVVTPPGLHPESPGPQA